MDNLKRKKDNEYDKEYVDVLTGVNNSVDKIVETTSRVTKSIVDYTKSTIESARAVVDLNKQAEIAAVINQGLIEKYDRQAEQSAVRRGRSEPRG